MLPFLLALSLAILLPLFFLILGLSLFNRWNDILGTDHFNAGDMKVPTFYSIENDGDALGIMFFFPVVGVIFGGIHCVGWFFDFPSSVEAMLWRVSSAVLTGTAVLLPLIAFILWKILKGGNKLFLILVLTTIFLVYVVARLLLLVEAFISLRHLTPGMLALVNWTAFIPHI